MTAGLVAVLPGYDDQPKTGQARATLIAPIIGRKVDLP
jgi:hypothetical protein